MVNVAVVGLGYWGPNLVRNLCGLQNAKVVALCDVNTSCAHSIGQRFCPNANVVSDYVELGKDRDIHAVVIATPISSHFELASFFLGSGKDVFVEKPLAQTVGECEKLIELADLNQQVLMVGHVFEYSGAVRRIKEYLDRGELGRLLYVDSQRVNLGRIRTDLNVVWSFAPHDVSIMNYWLAQDPIRVSARGYCYLNDGIEDVAWMTLEYPSHVAVHLHLGWLDPRKVRQMTLVGTKKMLIYDDVSPDSKIRIYDKGIEQLHDFLEAPESFAEFQFQVRIGDVIIPTLQFEEPLKSECQHFLDCISSRQIPMTDGRNGLRVVKALEAASRSIQEGGRPVELLAGAGR